MRAVCLKYFPFERPGAFATAPADRSVTLKHHLVPKDVGDLLIVMGRTISSAHPLARQHVSFPRVRAFRLPRPLFRGVAKAALHCAHRTTSIHPIVPSKLARSLSGMGAEELPLRASTNAGSSGLPRLSGFSG